MGVSENDPNNSQLKLVLQTPVQQKQKQLRLAGNRILLYHSKAPLRDRFTWQITHAQEEIKSGRS